MYGLYLNPNLTELEQKVVREHRNINISCLFDNVPRLRPGPSLALGACSMGRA